MEMFEGGGCGFLFVLDKENRAGETHTGYSHAPQLLLKALFPYRHHHSTQFQNSHSPVQVQSPQQVCLEVQRRIRGISSSRNSFSKLRTVTGCWTFGVRGLRFFYWYRVGWRIRWLVMLNHLRRTKNASSYNNIFHDHRYQWHRC